MNRQRLAILPLFILLLALASGVHAASGEVGFTLDCQGFQSTGGTLSLDRDNTGGMREAFIISAIDGAGNTIYEPDYDVFFVGTTVTIEDGIRESWTQAPRYNPLFLQIVSPAGNNHEEQIITQVAGTCADLPFFGRIDVLTFFAREAVRRLTGEAFVLQPADGGTGDPVELNAVPPRPVNPAGLATGQPGYAIVDTDNLFLRTGDSPRYEVVGIVDGGTELVVLGRNEDRSWWYVQVGGLRGWVSSEFLILRGDLTGVPEIPVLGSFISPSLYVGFAGNLLYTQPLIGAEAQCTLSGNTQFEVVGRTSNSAWYEIATTCDDVETTGWLPSEQGILRNPAGLAIPVTYGF